MNNRRPSFARSNVRQTFTLALLLLSCLLVAYDQAAGTPPAQATFPGSNGWIVFTSADADIFTMNPDGSDERNLTNSAAVTDIHPAWSGDGRIAWSRNGEIWEMGGDGSDPRRITSGSRDFWPAWSPDGTQIAFLRQPDPNFAARQVHVVATDGMSQPVKTPSDQDDQYEFCCVDWSPDGSRIAFQGRFLRPGGSQYGGGVWSVTPEGGDRTLLVPSDEDHVYNVTGISWAPGGDRLIVSGNGPTLPSQGLWITDLAGNAIQNLTPDEPGVTGNFSWSPDGAQVVYATGPEGIRVVSSAGGVPVTIRPNAGEPDWGPTPPLFQVEFTQAIQELQQLTDLMADLDADGKPPVPIVAGKPAAMRIYFEEVDVPTSYTVDISGQVTGSAPVQLIPGCDVEQRRKQENNCKSVDFYLTPPQGDWSVTLEVKNQAGTTISASEFNLTSDESDTILLKAVDVCHAQAFLLGPWACQSATPLLALAAHLRKIAPTDDVKVTLSGTQVRRKVSDYADGQQWMSDVVEDIDALYTFSDSLLGLLGQEVYYFGLTDPAAGGYNGLAAGAPARGALSRALTTSRSGNPITDTTVAHETAHMLGLNHTGTSLPAADCWGAGAGAVSWPFPDNKLHATGGSVEVGFDVETGRALPGDTTFEALSYCAPRWISPHRYLQMLGPTGPLSLGPVTPAAAAPAGVPAQYWLLRGSIDADTVTFDPLVEFDAEGVLPPDTGPFRIDVQDGAEGVLFSRAFEPAHAGPELAPGQEEPPPPPPSFSELIPVQPGAARIAVFDDTDAEIGSLTLEGASPAVSITDAGSSGGTVNVSWSASDPDSAEHTYWVDYSPDGGATWQNQGMGLTETSLAIAADSLAGSDDAVFLVIASDGVNSGEAVSAPFTVPKKLPHGEIIAPEGGSFREGQLVWLQAAAWDTDDGTLDDGAVTWSSSRDGALGSGASLPVYDLSAGAHTITMTARDSDDNTVTDTVQVTIFDGPIVEGGQQVLWGDLDCDGGLTTRDNQALLRRILQQNPLSQTEPCPALGAVVDVSGTGDRAWGDLDCDGGLTTRDNQALQRRVLQQAALSQIQPCPALGSTVGVRE